MWPQYTLIALMLFNAGLFLAKHGEPRIFNFFGHLIDSAVLLWLLYMGGFFKGLA